MNASDYRRSFARTSDRRDTETSGDDLLEPPSFAETAVIPAQAGTQIPARDGAVAGIPACAGMTELLDSRLRGNDGGAGFRAVQEWRSRGWLSCGRCDGKILTNRVRHREFPVVQWLAVTLVAETLPFWISRFLYFSY